MGTLRDREQGGGEPRSFSCDARRSPGDTAQALPQSQLGVQLHKPPPLHCGPFQLDPFCDCVISTEHSVLRGALKDLKSFSV